MDIAELRDDQLYTVREVAALLKVDDETVRRRIRRSSMEALRIGGTGPYRIRGSEVRKLLGYADPSSIAE